MRLTGSRAVRMWTRCGAVRYELALPGATENFLVLARDYRGDLDRSCRQQYENENRKTKQYKQEIEIHLEYPFIEFNYIVLPALDTLPNCPFP